MIDDKTGISAATAKSHKQVIWDLQALSCFHMAEEECLGSLAHTHRAVTPPNPHSHACTNRPGHRMCANACACQQILTNSHSCALCCCCCLFFSPFLSCTLRQVSAELLRRQAGKQAHQQRGRGAVSLMSSKAV